MALSCIDFVAAIIFPVRLIFPYSVSPCCQSWRTRTSPPGLVHQLEDNDLSISRFRIRVVLGKASILPPLPFQSSFSPVKASKVTSCEISPSPPTLPPPPENQAF